MSRGKGWRGEPGRHSLASRGIKTSRGRSKEEKTSKGKKRKVDDQGRKIILHDKMIEVDGNRIDVWYEDGMDKNDIKEINDVLFESDESVEDLITKGAAESINEIQFFKRGSLRMNGEYGGGIIKIFNTQAHGMEKSVIFHEVVHDIFRRMKNASMDGKSILRQSERGGLIKDSTPTEENYEKLKKMGVLPDEESKNLVQAAIIFNHYENVFNSERGIVDADIPQKLNSTYLKTGQRADKLEAMNENLAYFGDKLSQRFWKEKFKGKYPELTNVYEKIISFDNEKKFKYI